MKGARLSTPHSVPELFQEQEHNVLWVTEEQKAGSKLHSHSVRSIVFIAMENSSSLCPIVQHCFNESESLSRTVVQIGYLEVDTYSCPPLNCVWSLLEPAVYFWADHSRSLAVALRFRIWALVKNEDAFDTCGWTEVRSVMLPFWQESEYCKVWSFGCLNFRLHSPTWNSRRTSRLLSTRCVKSIRHYHSFKPDGNEIGPWILRSSIWIWDELRYHRISNMKETMAWIWCNASEFKLQLYRGPKRIKGMS